ncbi:MAG: allantoicase [Acidobacteriota bacterium]|nr:allantoicase [Acidobacteriota bacterium]
MSATAGLARLNGLGAEAAAAELLACCGSAAWSRALAGLRPFASEEALFAEAERVWWDLTPEDWRQAFAAHPRIGERAGGWSQAEQAGARDAAAPLLAELAAANRAYEDRFGHVFLICATGKSAGEMLRALRARIGNEPEEELRIAAGEQAKITRLRLSRLLL